MTSSHTLSASDHAALHEISEQLAEKLDRRVSIVRAGDRGDEATGTGPSEAAGAAGAVMELPVRADATVVGYIALDTMDRPALGPIDFDAIDAASALVKDVLRAAPTVAQDRESVLRDVLADDESRRRSAYEFALARGWLRPERGTSVRALLIDAAVSDIESTAFARRLGRLRPVPAYFAGRRSGIVYLVGQPSHGDLDELVLRQAEERGIRVLGIGSASPALGARDLRAAAEEAALAATLAATLPQFHPAVDARDLGGWLLLASAAADPAQLLTISPAAHALYAHADQTQRITVETYLDVGANVVAACDLLFLHRTTLYYRLERMPQVVREALADGFTRSTLHLALKLLRLWEATGRM